MFLTVSVLLAVLVGLARGGKWVNLGTFKFEKTWLVFIAIGLQFLVFNPVWDRHVGAGILTNLIYGASIMLLILFALVNSDIKGLRLLGLGVLLNGVAIAANGGSMPSSLDALSKILPAERMEQLLSGSAFYNVILISDNTRFKYLCDIFYIPGVNVYSIGDALIAAGAFITIQQIMLRSKGIDIYNTSSERG
ncbi:MAG: DUF5317 family protein [Bacillota bacterium]